MRRRSRRKQRLERGDLGRRGFAHLYLGLAIGA